MNILMNLIFASNRIFSTPRRALSHWLLALVIVGGYAMPAHALLTIEVNKGTAAPIPIAVVPFAVSGSKVLQPADIIETDLATSGRFTLLARANHLSRPHGLAQVNYKDWRLIKADAVVIGKVARRSDGQYEVQFRLLDVLSERQLAGQKFIVKQENLRRVAHQISDQIHFHLTAIAGAFDTRIAYVTLRGESGSQQYLLQVADSDGFSPTTVLESKQAILSPAWSPDGRQLAYVSFETNRSTIFIQDLASGERSLLAEFNGINGAPAWSPDGRQIALTLSKDGNPDLYIYTLATKKFQRLTDHSAIDTEPAWSPDGQSIIFTSSRSNGAQIYRIPAAGGVAKRITFHGDYNAGAEFSPDGKNIVLITNQGNGYKVAIYSVAEKTITPLTTTGQDESPSFAPNGDLIIYATKSSGRNILAAVSVDGQVQQTLALPDGLVREPDWSPFNHKL